MNKFIKRIVTVTMAFSMVVTSIVVTPKVEAKAATTAKSEAQAYVDQILAKSPEELDEYTGVVDEQWLMENDPEYEKFLAKQQGSGVQILNSTAELDAVVAADKIKWGKGLTHADEVKDFKKYYGIDVSHWQGTIDWKKVKDAGVEFAIIKMGGRSTSGSNYTDSKFVENIEAAHENGLKIGLYWYTQAIKASEATKEGEYMVKYIEPYKGWIYYPLMFDIENTSTDRMGKAKLSTKTRTSICKAFCKAVEKAGYKAGVYTYKEYFRSMLNTSELDSKYYIWLAEWKKKATYEGTYRMWQYSDGNMKNDNIIAYKIPGISTAVDLDVAYENIPDPVKKASYEESNTKSIKLSWSKVNKADGYQVTLCDEDGKTISSTNVEETSTTISDLEAGTKYKLKVRAYFYFENMDEYSYGKYSPTLTAYTYPDKVSSIKESASSKNTLTLSWTKVTGATKYIVYKYNSKTKKFEKVGEAKGTSYKDKKLATAKTYRYKIKAVMMVEDKAYNSALSSEFVGVTKTYKVTGIKEEKITTNSIKLSWAKQTGVTGYEVYCYDAGGKLIEKVLTDKNSITRKDLPSATAYSFKVHSFIKTKSSALAKGEFSSKLNCKTLPMPVTNLAVKSVKANTITYKWTKVSGAAGYYIYSGKTLIGKSSKNSFTWKKRSSGTKYTITVVAYTKLDKRVICSKSTPAFSVYTKATKITGLKLTGGKKEVKVKLSWDKLKGVKKYRIFRYTEAGVLVDTVDTKNNYYTYKKHRAGSYSYKVAAVLETGDYVTVGARSEAKATYVIPHKVEGLLLNNVTATEAVINWNKIVGAEGYYVMQYDNSTKTYKQIAKVTECTYTMSGLTPNSEYQVKVVAYIKNKNKVIKGESSDVLAITTPQDETQEEE